MFNLHSTAIPPFHGYPVSRTTRGLDRGIFSSGGCSQRYSAPYQVIQAKRPDEDAPFPAPLPPSLPLARYCECHSTVEKKLLFTSCLRTHGLWPSSSPEQRSTKEFEDVRRVKDRTHVPSSVKVKLSGEEGLLAGILLEAFRAPTPRRAVALGRDQAHLQQWYVCLVHM